MCTWGTWHVINHVEVTHTESHKKMLVNSVMGSHHNSTFKLLQSSSSCSEQVLAFAFIKWYVHVSTCTWHVVTHVEETHTEPGKKIEPIRLSEPREIQL